MSLMGDKRNPRYNQSGCADPTAYEAISNIIKEEKELDKKVHNLIRVLKLIIDWAGFELIDGRIGLINSILRRLICDLSRFREKGVY